MRSFSTNLRQLSPSVILLFLMLISISEAQIPEDKEKVKSRSIGLSTIITPR